MFATWKLKLTPLQNIHLNIVQNPKNDKFANLRPRESQEITFARQYLISELHTLNLCTNVPDVRYESLDEDQRTWNETLALRNTNY